jgi:hypothetical protein
MPARGQWLDHWYVTRHVTWPTLRMDQYGRNPLSKIGTHPAEELQK